MKRTLVIFLSFFLITIASIGGMIAFKTYAGGNEEKVEEVVKKPTVSSSLFTKISGLSVHYTKRLLTNDFFIPMVTSTKDKALVLVTKDVDIDSNRIIVNTLLGYLVEKQMVDFVYIFEYDDPSVSKFINADEYTNVLIFSNKGNETHFDVNAVDDTKLMGLVEFIEKVDAALSAS